MVRPVVQPYLFSSPEGYQLVRDILKPHYPHDPHDYQLEGVCKCLDGSDLLAVLATGSGKTAYYSMYMLVLRALSQRPLPAHPLKVVPADPAMVIVYPTLSLEEEMQVTFEALGLSTVVINHRTLDAGRKRGENLFVTARSGVSMILLSPEMLSHRNFAMLTENSAFSARMCALGVDEVHLCNSWGQGLRPAFLEIGFVRARLSKNATLILTTATLAPGPPTHNILKFFGLSPGRFHLIRRSNLRPEIQILFRTLTRGASGFDFPDFKWVLDGQRKTIIYCPKVHHGDRLGTYLRSVAPPSPDPAKRVRMYNSAQWAEYNVETLRLFREDATAHIIIASDALMVGIDLPNVQDVVLTGVPKTADEMLQKVGRAARNRLLVTDARGIIYMTKGTAKSAHAMVAGHAEKKTGGGKFDSDASFDLGMAQLVVAACKTEGQNRLYGNPSSDPPCTCTTCTSHPLPIRRSCNCSGCMAEAQPILAVGKARQPAAANPVKVRDRLDKLMRAHGTSRLLELRRHIYALAPPAESAIFPSYIYLPDPVIKHILDRFALLKAIDDLDPILEGRVYLQPHKPLLWSVLDELRGAFANMRAEKKRKQAASKILRQQRDESVEGGEHSGEDGESDCSDDTDEERVDAEVAIGTALPPSSGAAPKLTIRIRPLAHLNIPPDPMPSCVGQKRKREASEVSASNKENSFEPSITDSHSTRQPIPHGPQLKPRLPAPSFP